MNGLLHRLARDCSGASAAEMALVTPLLLIIMFGSVELGNYFMNEHSLVKAVRDGARFAARQSFSSYPDCSTVDATTQSAIKNVVMYGYLSGSNTLTPNISASNITITTSCAASAASQNMLGIYRGRASGAQLVNVSATVSYRSVLGSLGFSGISANLNAASQAAVQGI
jgi:Flp pilus assembly protein TadG